MKKLLVLPLLLVFAACDQSAPTADPSVITSRSSEWDVAYNAGDIDALVALYTDDARIMAPNSETLHGSDGVRAAFSNMINAGLTSELTSIETRVAGDIGYNVGHYVMSANGEQVDEGKYIETWRRGENGVWRIANDIFNSDLPVAEPAMPETHLLITHRVNDADTWLAAWRGEDSRHKLFAENGAIHVHTFQSAEDPNLTGLVVAVSDMDALNAMLTSEEGVAAAAADGVQADTMIMLQEVN